MSWWPSTFKKRPFMFWNDLVCLRPSISNLFSPWIYNWDSPLLRTVHFRGPSTFKIGLELLRSLKIKFILIFIFRTWTFENVHFWAKTAHFGLYTVKLIFKNDRPLSNRLNTASISTYSDSYSVLTNKNFKYHKLIRSN